MTSEHSLTHSLTHSLMTTAARSLYDSDHEKVPNDKPEESCALPSIPLHDISELTTGQAKSVSICMRKKEEWHTHQGVDALVAVNVGGKSKYTVACHYPISHSVRSKNNTSLCTMVRYQSIPGCALVWFNTSSDPLHDPIEICACRVVGHANRRHSVKTRGTSPTLMLVRLVFRMFRLDRRCANSGSYILLFTLLT